MSNPVGYPRTRYAKGGKSVLVQNAGEDKALGPGWYEHPRDAEAQRVLSPEERGNMKPVSELGKGSPAPAPAQRVTMVPYAGPERRVAQVPLEAGEEDLRVVAFRYPAKA